MAKREKIVRVDETGRKIGIWDTKYFNQILMFILLLIVGFIFSLQIRAIEDNRKKTQAGKNDYNYYANLLANEKAYTKTSTEALNELKVKKNELIQKALENTGDVAILEAFQKINDFAGFTQKKGSGIRVTLDDQFNKDPAFPAATSAIHDLDIRNVIDLMKSAGAIAISINGERLVGTSELTCNGPTVQVNKRKFPVPYVIEAIGDAVQMKTLIENDEYLQGRIISNISFKLEVKDEIIINGFSDYDKIEQYISALKEVKKT
jgi:uncharacterized protein YlxW (UPF0749 family)